jgi:hypothetical protein
LFVQSSRRKPLAYYRNTNLELMNALQQSVARYPNIKPGEAFTGYS